MKGLAKAFDEIRNLPYIEGGLNLEASVIEIISKNLPDFSVFDFTNKEKKESYELNGEMPCKAIYFQPYGSQNPPDVLIILEDGREIKVECKSKKGSCPIFNDNGMKNDSIYIFSGYKGKVRGTTIRFGVGNAEKAKEIFDKIRAEYVARMNQEIAEMMIDEIGETPSVVIPIIRPQWVEVDKSEKNWISHPDKSAREEAVINKMMGI